jgi:DNA-binding ferritin-like protein (Dps family)
MENIQPTWQDLTPTTKAVPSMQDWYLANVITGVTEESLPWMLAQGWEVISSYQSGASAATAVTKYSMRRVTMQNWNVLTSLLTDFTNAYNEGRSANDKRYEDIIRQYDSMLSDTQQHLTSAHTTIANQVSLHMTTLDGLDEDYDTFYAEIKDELANIDLTGETDVTRINNAFTARESAMQQRLMDSGMYSSGIFGSIGAGLEAKKQEALTEAAEKLQLRKVDFTLRKNQVYLNVLQARQGIINAKMGLTDREDRFLAYQLDERNKVLMGLFGFVERRSDSYPDLGSLAQLTASLAETGAATWQSV